MLSALRNRMLASLDRFAGGFVTAAWLLLIFTLIVAVTAGVPAAVLAFYHPLHRAAPMHEMTVRVLWACLLVGGLVVVVSTLAYWFGWRRFASASVVVSWVLALAGSAGALASVKPGPESFVRYVGEQRFSVPWQFTPYGLEYANEGGFSIRLCPETRVGAYDERGCRRSEQFRVAPVARGLIREFDVKFWRERRHEMQRGEQRDGHDAYTHEIAVTGRPPRTLRYYALHDDKGELVRLVQCGSWGGCMHHVRTGEYILSYGMRDESFSRWAEIDRDLVALLGSWRVE